MKDFLFLMAISAVFFSANGLTDNEMKAYFVRLVMQCRKEHPVELSELFEMVNLKTPTKKNVKCILACAYKRDGLMNDKGLFDLEHAYSLAEMAGSGDEQRLTNGKKLADICINEVNAEEVADGEAGCDRSALMFKCGVKNVPKFGFKLL